MSDLLTLRGHCDRRCPTRPLPQQVQQLSVRLVHLNLEADDVLLNALVDFARDLANARAFLEMPAGRLLAAQHSLRLQFAAPPQAEAPPCGLSESQKARDALAAFDAWSAKGRLFELERDVDADRLDQPPTEASGAAEEHQEAAQEHQAASREQQACGVDAVADAQEGEELEKALSRALKVS